MPDLSVPAELRDPKTPDDVKVTLEAREPVWDPTLGIPVNVPPGPAPRHRLVTIGDSLTHGFQSAAIFDTELSYPAIIAHELGWLSSFRRPSYPGFGGLPLNLEYLIRQLESAYGDTVDWWELVPAGLTLRSVMDQVEDHWERGPGSQLPARQGINHNLAVYGWDLRDTLSRNADVCLAGIQPAHDEVLLQLVENANERAGLRVLDSARDGAGRALTPLEAAAELGRDGEIETLIVFLGANNALPTVVKLEVEWSDTGYDDLEQKQKFTVWRPTHFEAELKQVVAAVQQIRARHVIWATVPHVTIAPLARGVHKKMVRRGPNKSSRYFPYYTRVWISDDDFNAREDPCITGNQARAIDSAIDQYNDAITAAVRAARQAGRDWYLLDIAGVLDRLASKRYLQDRLAQPSWWRGPYELPPELKALQPELTSRFFASGPQGRTAGGLFSLDGVHPTTIAYGILAQEFINVMRLAGVKFYAPDGTTERQGPIKVDFNRLIARDALISDPPRSISSDLALVGWLDAKVHFSRWLLRAGT